MAGRSFGLALVVIGMLALGRAGWIARDTFDAADDVMPPDAIVVDETLATAAEPALDALDGPAVGAASAPGLPVDQPVIPLADIEAEVADIVDAPTERSADGSAAPAALPAGAGVPTRLAIPSIRVDSPIVGVSLVTRMGAGGPVASWQVARNAIGFHTTSAAIGSIGNTILSGHNNRLGSVFRNLAKVSRGDTLLVYVDGVPRAYTVTDKVIARVDGVSEKGLADVKRWLAQTTDERLTLVSCWPPTGNTHRVFVVAMPAP